MDLRRLTPDDREGSSELARKLKVALNNQGWIDLADLSDENAGFLDGGLPAWQDHVAEGDALYEELGPSWIDEKLPKIFFEWTALGMALWQWCGLVILVLVSWLVSLLFAGGLVRILGKLFTRDDDRLDSRIVRVVRGPVRLGITVVVFGTWRQVLALPIPATKFMRTAGHLVFVVASTWLVFRLIDLAVLQVRVRAQAQGRDGLLPVIQPVQVFAKVMIVAFGLLAVLGTFGVNVSALIAGLGVGGIAVALAAQKTLENLFGGVTLFADRPVRVGEYFKSGEVQGTVEEIGLRSTRIRTRDRTVVTIPNADFSNMALEILPGAIPSISTRSSVCDMRRRQTSFAMCSLVCVKF